MRLTRKIKNKYYMVCEIDASDGIPNVKEYANKLGQLEDIEEKIGIDLITLLKNRSLSQIIGYVWYKTKHPKTNKEIIIKRDVWDVQDNGVIVVRSYDEEYVTGLNIKDYGVTWALTKEELL